MATKFINELNFNKKGYDSFDRNPAVIGFVNDLAEELAVGASFYSDQDQTVAIINTAYVASLNNTVYANGVSIDSATRKIITVGSTGTYSFDFTVQVNKSEIVTNPGNMIAWLTVNGTAQAGTASKLGFAVTNADLVMTLHSHLLLNAGDTVSLNYAADRTTLALKASAASAPYPAVSSVSLEIDKVRQG
jgi:hypothetical protein